MSDASNTVLLRALLEELHTLNERMAATATNQSSVQINTSARGHDIQVKAYDGSPVRGAGDAAIDEYLRIRAEIERRLMGGT